MIYKDFQDIRLSALGLGCMRLPGAGRNEFYIDEEETAKMIEYAIQKGVNYFDTAWGYHSGNSETVMGKLLKKYPRESFYLATKFPGYDLSNMGKIEEIFEKQLQKLQMDYVDFYLFHNVCELNIDEYLNPNNRIMEYMLEQKKNGRIRHIGFSVHGNMETTKRFLDAYGEHMEFCQVQLNWIDWDFQEAKEKVALLNHLNIPIWVMEPLRGGKLVALSEKHTKVLNGLRPDTSTPAWAFRYLQTIPGVTMVLSGMSNFAQMADNIQTFQTEEKLNDTELNALYGIAKEMLSGIPCTACRYCTDHCPKHIDIPEMIALYNEHSFTGGGFIATMALQAIPEENRPSACIGCRSCEALCPQQIKISEVMQDFAAKIK